MALEPPKYLPEDVLRIILSKLTVKSVVRFGVVCKTWYHIVGCMSFAKTHLSYQKSASNPNKYILYQNSHLCTLLTHSHSVYDKTLKHSKLYDVNDILRRYEATSYSPYVDKIYGVCNGLLCLSSYYYVIGQSIYLWNPTCRKIKKLPQLDNSVKDAVGYTIKTSLSFGYYEDDFKVIVTAPLGNAYIVLVYSLNTNSWNRIQIKFDHDEVYVKDKYYTDSRVLDTKFVDGTVYIIERGHVRCFDLSNETIRVIHFPKEINSPNSITSTNYTAETYGESIAIFKFERQPRSLTMWILKDKSSFVSAWEKRLDNITFSCNYYLVGLLNNGNYLVSREEQGPKKCYLCDLDSPRLREVTFVRGSPYICGRTHSNYVETLFLLKEDHLDPIVFCSLNGKSLPESAV